MCTFACHTVLHCWATQVKLSGCSSAGQAGFKACLVCALKPLGQIVQALCPPGRDNQLATSLCKPQGTGFTNSRAGS